MKKRIVLKIISLFFSLLTILAIVSAFTVTGSGFIDLSNIIRVICICIAVICGTACILLWKKSKS